MIRNEKELIDNALKGDQKAYANLMGHYKKSLKSYIGCIVHDRNDAEDLMVESFEKAFRKLDTYSPEFAFSTWLYRIAFNRSMDFLRKKKIEKTDLNNHLNEPSTELNAEERMMESEKGKKIRGCLEKLKPDFRKVLEMRYLKEMTYKEISEELSITEGLVRIKLHRGRKAFKKIIEKYYH